MEEIFKRLGVTIEGWIISIFAAALIVIYRIYEQDEPTSRRKRVRIVIMGLTSALLVPGLVVYWAGVQNAFLSGAITGISVYCFELLIDLAKKKVTSTLRDKTNETS
jgi:membrane protein CcdC involved in cytochrome C biogenesis